MSENHAVNGHLVFPNSILRGSLVAVGQREKILVGVLTLVTTICDFMRYENHAVNGHQVFPNSLLRGSLVAVGQREKILVGVLTLVTTICDFMRYE